MSGRPVRLVLPGYLVDACEKYLAWDDSKDPSRLGAFNASSYIGEHVSALYAATKAKRVDWRRVVCETCGAKRGENCKAMSGVILPDSSRRRMSKPHRARLERAKRGGGS